MVPGAIGNQRHPNQGFTDLRFSDELCPGRLIRRQGWYEHISGCEREQDQR
jgi:hypothetical protein